MWTPRCTHPALIFQAFYLALITLGIAAFLRDGWIYLSPSQKLLAMTVVPTPYVTLYLAAYTDPGIITPENVSRALAMYPADDIIFPAVPPSCRTCHTPKPARSKHCSICKGCVAKHDHHCIWINNCVGLNNTRYFILFLLATNVLLLVGGVLSFGVLTTIIDDAGIEKALLSWGGYIGVYSLAIVQEVYIGAVFLICGLCGVLSAVFTGYHGYLIWAGTTTSETMKWADWKEDIQDGMVFMADEEEEEEEVDPRGERWRRQRLWRLGDGEGTETLPRDALWKRVESLDEVENIYDEGGWRNLADAMFPQRL